MSFEFDAEVVSGGASCIAILYILKLVHLFNISPSEPQNTILTVLSLNHPLAATKIALRYPFPNPESKPPIGNGLR